MKIRTVTNPGLNISCLLALSLLAACSSGGGGNPNGVRPGVALKPTPTGVMTVTRGGQLNGGMPPTDLQLPSPACAGGAMTFDKRLHIGDVFTSTSASVTQDSANSGTTSKTVQTIDASHLSTLMTVSDIVKSPAIANVPPQLRMQLDCTISGDGSSSKCEPTFLDGFTPTPEMMTSSKSCYAKFDMASANVTGTAVIGTYKMKSGQSIDVEGVDRVAAHAQIICQKGNDPEAAVGTGTYEEITIQTHDLLTESPSPCQSNSTTVFRYVSAKLDDGTVVYTSKEEVLAAPQR